MPKSMKAKANILAKPHPYIFFTLQLDCAWKLLGSYSIATYKAQISYVCIDIGTLYMTLV